MNKTAKPLKQPISVLVVLHNEQGEILLLERADNPGFWQSVTGSIEPGETLADTVCREVMEETGIVLEKSGLLNWHQQQEYEIFAHWRHRYPPGVTHNTEHVFSACIPTDTAIRLSAEHTRYQWLAISEAAKLVFSPSNREAILDLPSKYQSC
ncbi:dihydroneopterin triphosphate pyrophosphatase [Neisseria arctica]|uniref:Dihydroneopterin triphosphate pyrophosphatase n=1 Tax=Neisseria arctica TaxID=1470200 RepID=A0A0J0YQJ1_9NEIS|nr:dihydroneopterin triphosphate diphosphatase [Neisseria arctica]KLT72389.1 dihydroneopterin triphosphate pyrophosphatase [Neisseria arctica]UOO86038.1 dihydroneopterin triphosphate diphosphatase [Neisseria arctica]